MTFFRKLYSFVFLLFHVYCAIIYTGWNTPIIGSVEFWSNLFLFWSWVIFIVTVLSTQGYDKWSAEESQRYLNTSLNEMFYRVMYVAVVMCLAGTGHFWFAVMWILTGSFELYGFKLIRKNLSKEA